MRDDLAAVLLPNPAAAQPGAALLLEALSAAQRPESIHAWKRNPNVRQLLTGLGDGTVPATHKGMDEAARLISPRAVEHLRAVLVTAGALPPKDPYLARFELWIDDKLKPLPDEIAHPVKQFAAWHHLRRIRVMADTSGAIMLRGPVHSAKQEITETVKFLTWLHNTHSRTAVNCTQLDVDAWLTTGPTTRAAIRTFFVFAKTNRINAAVIIKSRLAQTTPSLTQEQRLTWINELLTGASESLPYRIAGTLVLLLAQPVVRIAALRVDDLDDSPTGLTLSLGAKPVPVTEPFAELLRHHARNRPNLRTHTGPSTPWLFPGTRAGQHLHPNTIMHRLRTLGIDLRGARHRALTDLVTEIPPPIVAEALGCSNQVAFKYAEAAAGPWTRYRGLRPT